MATLELEEKPEIDLQTASDRPWRVIVRNDSHNSFEGVATALSQVLPGVSYPEGMALAEKIDRQGRAVVWSGPKETAEFYWLQLQDRGLTMAPLRQ